MRHARAHAHAERKLNLSERTDFSLFLTVSLVPKIKRKTRNILPFVLCELFGSAMDRDTQTVRERNRNKRISDLFIYYVNFNVNHTFTWRRKGPEGSCNRL